MASKEDKLDIRNAKRSASARKKGGLRVSNSAAKELNKTNKADVKRGSSYGFKVRSSGAKLAKTNSPTKPSVASKVNAKNKMKAQGARAMSGPTSGYNKRSQRGK